jgi:hypothetical protein
MPQLRNQKTALEIVVLEDCECFAKGEGIVKYRLGDRHLREDVAATNSMSQSSSIHATGKIDTRDKMSKKKKDRLKDVVKVSPLAIIKAANNRSYEQRNKDKGKL